MNPVKMVVDLSATTKNQKTYTLYLTNSLILILLFDKNQNHFQTYSYIFHLSKFKIVISKQHFCIFSLYFNNNISLFYYLQYFNTTLLPLSIYLYHQSNINHKLYNTTGSLFLQKRRSSLDKYFLFMYCSIR